MNEVDDRPNELDPNQHTVCPDQLYPANEGGESDKHRPYAYALREHD